MLLVSPLIRKAGIECVFDMYMYRLLSLSLSLSLPPVLEWNYLPFHIRHIQEEVLQQQQQQQQQQQNQKKKKKKKQRTKHKTTILTKTKSVK